MGQPNFDMADEGAISATCVISKCIDGFHWENIYKKREKITRKNKKYVK